jgi:hypothetical protein
MNWIHNIREVQSELDYVIGRYQIDCKECPHLCMNSGGDCLLIGLDISGCPSKASVILFNTSKRTPKGNRKV